MEESTLARPADRMQSAESTVPWAVFLLLGGLLAVVFAHVLWIMAYEWYDDQDMGHGFFVPVVAGYIAWQRRDKLATVPYRPNWLGWVVIVLGFGLLIAGTLGADFFVQRAGFLASLLGVILAVWGWPMIRALAFPLLLLPFMVRIPLFIYSQITFPLQLFASAVAETVLGWLGVLVLREGNILELADGHRLSVVEACSGIRSLLSLSFLSLVYSYFFDNRVWMRWVLLVATVPIAITANASRVTLTGLITEYKRELAEGIYHSFEGWVIFMVAGAALILLHQIICRATGYRHANS